MPDLFAMMANLPDQARNIIIGVGAVIFVMLVGYCFVWFLRNEMGTEHWKTFVHSQFPLFFGLPMASTAAFGLVVFFGATTPGPIKLNIWGFDLEGPAGPLLMWVIVFLALVLAIKTLTRG